MAVDSDAVQLALSGPRYAWSLTLYPEAREAGGCFGRIGGEVEPSSSGVPDPERSAEEAARRARGKVRRYCAAHRLNRLGTLTYRGEGCHDPLVLRSDVHDFFRALRRSTGGTAFPYLWASEWHKSGHGLHVHFAVGRYVKRGLIDAAWGRGFVHIKLLGNLPAGSGPVEEARRAAGYLSKYVGKDFDARRSPGLHRYEVAQGFQPRAVRLRGRTERDVIAKAARLMGSAPVVRWSSEDVPGWDRPAAVWVQWAG